MRRFSLSLSAAMRARRSRRSLSVLVSRCVSARGRLWSLELLRACRDDDLGWADSARDALRLMARTSSIRRLSCSSSRRCSGVRSARRKTGSTGSPRLYLLSISSFSAAGLRLSGWAVSSMSSSVATVALCLVSRTGARHDGHVKTGESAGGGVAAFSAAAACQLNHSFTQAPQKVWRQSSRVRGWYRISAQIWRCG